MLRPRARFCSKVEYLCAPYVPDSLLVFPDPVEKVERYFLHLSFFFSFFFLFEITTLFRNS